MKAVFHVSRDDRELWERGLGNISNLLDDPTIDLREVVLVVNGGGARLVKRRSRFSSQLGDLVDRGLVLSVCRNSIESSEVGEDDLLEAAVIVPSAMGELTRRQCDGYAYIKP